MMLFICAVHSETDSTNQVQQCYIHVSMSQETLLLTDWIRQLIIETSKSKLFEIFLSKL